MVVTLNKGVGGVLNGALETDVFAEGLRLAWPASPSSADPPGARLSPRRAPGGSHPLLDPLPHPGHPAPHVPSHGHSPPT